MYLVIYNPRLYIAKLVVIVVNVLCKPTIYIYLHIIYIYFLYDIIV